MADRCPKCKMLGFHLGDCPQRVGNDAINPSHYRHVSGIETIKVNRAMTYDVGNSFKYVLRHRDKGHPLQDLTKSRWHIADAVNNDDGRIWSRADHIEAAVNLTKMWKAETYAESRDFFRALLDMDLTAAGFVVEVMMRKYL